MNLRLFCLVIVGLACASPVNAQSLDLRGEVSSAVTVNDVEPRSTYLSGRYVPELFAEIALTPTTTLAALGSVDARATARMISLDDVETDDELDVYRLWLRYGAPQIEARVGLQKIAFGSATLLRPLMWFDRVDPRDPLQITDGVQALLLRYYFLGNANVWLWGLLGNDETKGWELLPSTSRDPEFGGRVQTPLGPGEIALSYHHRWADASALVPPGLPAVDTTVPEDRLGLDGKWDATLGLWFEAVLVRQRSDLLEREYRRQAVLGADYTFDLGGGLTVLGEHYLADVAASAFGSGDGAATSALSATYRWGVVDELGAILYYDWRQDILFKFATWRRTYDHWAFNLLVFVNPDAAGFGPGQPSSELLAGTGAQVLVSFNH